MNYIIFDLEATCWTDSKGRQNETIEIGAVLINKKKEIVKEFEKFIKPKVNPELSDFCKELTSISQENVDNADSFDVVIEEFKNWINIDEKYILCSWGKYDKKQFTVDSELHNLPVKWLKHHISIKHQYYKFKKLKRPVGMMQALRFENLSLDGIHHRGIDDARNIAKIFLANFEDWNFKY